MKSKNMRKKALLSSVAMLLVAVVAMSGATYAWFTANTAASIKGMNMKAGTATSLLFCETNSTDVNDWGPEIDFGANYTEAPVVVPCSTVNGVNLFYVNASSATPEGNLPQNTLVSSISTAAAYGSAGTGAKQYIEETFYAKAGNGGTLKVSSFTFGESQNWRFSVQVGSESTAKIFSGDGTTSYKGLNGTTITANTKTFANLYAGAADTPTAEVTAYTGNENICTLQAGVPQQITVRAWLEGNTSDCNDGLANREMDGLTINFSL